MKGNAHKKRKNGPPMKWKLFERLVAAIHYAESRGAKVVWNDKIKRRQFDVTVRFQYGLYSYLTVIECRDKARPLSVDNIDGFVTKSRSAKANKAIMVSSSGYQDGCIEVAKENNIELFTLEKINHIPKSYLSAKLTPTLNIYDVRLHSQTSSFVLPQQKSILPYLMKNTYVQYDGNIISIDDLISLHNDKIMSGISPNERKFEINLSPHFKIEIPNLSQIIYATSLTFKYRLLFARIIEHSSLDSYVSSKLHERYEYKNAVQNSSKLFSVLDLSLGFDTLLEVGKFYFNPALDFCYYCSCIENNMVSMLLLESYQHGTLLQAEFNMELEAAKRFIEITDNTEISRLKTMLLKFDQVQRH